MINKVYEHERVKRKIEAIGSKRVRERERVKGKSKIESERLYFLSQKWTYNFCIISTIIVYGKNREKNRDREKEIKR